MIKFNARKLAAVAIAQDINSGSRPYLAGVYFSGDKAVATDGKLMTVATDDSFNDGHHIMPVSKKAITALKNKKADLVIFANDTLSVRSDQDEMLYLEPCKEIDGTFPEWKNVVPDDTGVVSHGTFAWSLLERIVQTAKILSNGLPGISFKGKGNMEPHIVTYHANADVFSVVMPFRRTSSK